VILGICSTEIEGFDFNTSRNRPIVEDNLLCFALDIESKDEKGRSYALLATARRQSPCPNRFPSHNAGNRANLANIISSKVQDALRSR